MLVVCCLILLIEADPTIRKHLSTLLDARGYQCLAIPSLEAALAEAPRRSYAVVVVDLDLAGSDAGAMAGCLRGAAPTAQLVGLDAGGGVRGLEAFDLVVAKPFLAEPLLAAISQLLPPDAPWGETSADGLDAPAPR